jgi:hypothetical protein
MKKILALILGLSMLLGIAACNKKVEVPSKKDAKAAVEEEYDMKFKLDSEDISDDESEAEWVFVSKDGTLEVTVTWDSKNPKEFEFDDKELGPTETETVPTEIETETSETTEATTTTTAASSETSASGTNSVPVVEGGIIRFDDMCFFVNGKKFVLGKSTLQDMIDAGVPFDEDDLGDANNNLKSNYQSSSFDIRLAEYYHASIYVLNYSDEGKPMSQCVVNEIRIYLRDIDQDVLSFEFPMNITPADLIKLAGQPNNEINHYEGEDNYVSDTYEYSKESDIYYGDSYYEFRFVNGELADIAMSWMP